MKPNTAEIAPQAAESNLTTDSSERSRQLESVLRAAEWNAGWPLIPAYRQTKQPAWPRWREHNWQVDKAGRITQTPVEQSPVEQSMVALALTRPDRSVLRVLDHLTHSIAVIDVDEPGGRTPDEIQALLATYGAPRTPLWVTTGREGGGVHFYYRRVADAPEGYQQLNGAVGLKELGLPGDLKARGSYVVAPYAVHKTGAVYTPSAFGSLREAYEHLPVMPLDAWLRLRNGIASLGVSKTLGSKSKAPKGSGRVKTEKQSGGRLDAENRTVDLRGVQADDGWLRKPWMQEKMPVDRGECPECGSETALRVMDGGVRCWSCKTVFQPPSAADHTSVISTTTSVCDQLRAPACWAGAVAPLPIGPDGYLRPELTAAKAEVWAAPMGAGKTTAAAAIAAQAEAAGQEVIVVSPRVTLSQRMARIFGVADYKAQKGAIHGSTSICAMSLHRLDLRDRRYTLVVDEVEQTLAMMLQLQSGSEADSRRLLFRLAALVAGAERVLLLDADAGPLTAALLGLARVQDAVWRVAPPKPPRSFVHAGHTSEHFERIADDAAEASVSGLRVAVACGSRARAVELRRYLVRRGHRVLLVSSEHRDELTDEALNACSVLIYTPALSTGVSLDQRNYWLCTHLITAQSSGDGHQAMQMISRVRHPVREAVHVSGPATARPSLPRLNPATYRDLAVRRAQTQAEGILALQGVPVLHDLAVSRDAAVYLDFWALAQAETARNGNNWVLRWLLGDSVDTAVVQKNEAVADEVTEIRQELREERADAVGAVTSAELDAVEAAPEGSTPDLTPSVREALTLRRRYGQAAETQEQRRELALCASPERRWAQVQRFSRAWAVAEFGAVGARAVRALDEAEQRHASAATCTPHVEQVGLLTEGLRRLGVDLTGTDQSPVEISFEAAEDFAGWVARTADRHRLARIHVAPAPQPRKVLGMWLQLLGLSTVRVRQNGGWTYYISQVRLSRMRGLAARARSDLLLVSTPTAISAA